MRKQNKNGGGSQTNVNGLLFERETSLESAIQNLYGFAVENDIVYKNGTMVGMMCAKMNLYVSLLKPMGVDYKKILSKKLLPDEAFYNFLTNTIYIFEKKFQMSAGSVDEKLQTCDFKKRQYEKLFSSLDIKVEYIYILNDWFLKKEREYRDVYDYIQQVGCKYFFENVPVEEIGLGMTKCHTTITP